MKYFKDIKNNLHEVDDAFVNLLPMGLIEISKESFIELSKPTLREIELKQNAELINQLNGLDMATIRAMREYIASKADAPQILKDRETLAAQLRAKLK